jgi:hypothetical protein
LVEDPKWELAILATVQGFYEKLLQESVDGEVPVPSGLEAISLQQSDGDVSETLGRMRRWLRLLDMAVTPAMLRRAFTSDVDPEIAEAMLRYFTRKKDASDVNRDKTDLIVTFLYRHPRVPGQWERRGYGLDGALPLSPFEIALLEILADTDIPSLSEDHVQLLRRFDPLQEQAGGYADLNALIESGTIQTAREIKQALDLSFYHPGVLAAIAAYNCAVSKSFDSLFHAATAEIKSFAEALEDQGGSILGNVDGVDVTVDHVSAMHDGDLLGSDYSAALEKFRRISRLKQVLERRPPIRRTSRLVRPAVSSTPTDPQPSVPVRPASVDVPALRAAITPQQIAAEETKLSRIEESIRIFVRVADPKFRQVVPMRFFNLTLTPHEADAFCADYLEEKSLRAGVARVLLRLVAICARFTTELEELKRVENSPSLWKLHADSLITLLEVARAAGENARKVTNLAQQNGRPKEAAAITLPLQKLQECSGRVIKTLSNASAERTAGASAK